MLKEQDVVILTKSYLGKKFKDFIYIKICEVFSDSPGEGFYRVSDLDETIFGYILPSEIRQVD